MQNNLYGPLRVISFCVSHYSTMEYVLLLKVQKHIALPDIVP